jgi:hypothetical protein
MSKKYRKTGDERLKRWTDKSNEYEEMDSTEHESPNSVFPFEEKKEKGKKKKVKK